MDEIYPLDLKQPNTMYMMQLLVFNARLTTSRYYRQYDMINTLLFVYICNVVMNNSVPESEGLDSINRCVCLILGPGFRPPYVTRGCQFGVHIRLGGEVDVHFCNIVKLLPLTVHSFILESVVSLIII
jgi:hypothetical protein